VCAERKDERLREGVSRAEKLDGKFSGGNQRHPNFLGRKC